MPAKVTHITFAHEIGHNFGSPVGINYYYNARFGKWSSSNYTLVFLTLKQ